MGRKQRITVSIDSELLDWLDAKVGERLFANRSHGLEFLISLRKKEEREHQEYVLVRKPRGAK